MFEAGTHVSERIELLEPLASGAFGALWRGRHRTLGCDVAVKLLTELDEEARSRFDAEARMIARLNNPHIVQIFDSGVFADTPYIVMELLDGESLGHRLERDGVLPLALVRTVVAQAARALDHAHWQDVVHRDVKPENIFLCTDDEGRLIVKLLDFGIARPAWARSTRRFTADGAMMGSPAYMSPEQITDSKRVTAAADVWSLAVVAFEALTGVLPFGHGMGDDVAGTVAMILSRRMGTAEAALHALPDPVVEVFEQAFAVALDERFAKASGFSHALARCMDDEELVVAGVKRRPRWWLAPMGAAAIMGVIPFIGSWSDSRYGRARSPGRGVTSSVPLRIAPDAQTAPDVPKDTLSTRTDPASSKRTGPEPSASALSGPRLMETPPTSALPTRPDYGF